MYRYNNSCIRIDGYYDDTQIVHKRDRIIKCSNNVIYPSIRAYVCV